jgi:hypothetical protein
MHVRGPCRLSVERHQRQGFMRCRIQRELPIAPCPRMDAGSTNIRAGALPEALHRGRNEPGLADVASCGQFAEAEDVFLSCRRTS